MGYGLNELPPWFRVRKADTSLRSRRLEVVGRRKNVRTRRRHARGDTTPDTFSTAVTRHKQQASGRLRTANNTLVKCFFKFMPLESVSFHQSCPSFDGMRSVDNRSRQVLLSKEYLTVIPRARMGSESEWAIDSEAMRARGITVLVKSN